MEPTSTRVEDRWGVYWHDDEGEFHRTDGPAVVHTSGKEEWYRHGVRHRDNGPAVFHPMGRLYWYVNGRLHRTDGPAVVREDRRWLEWHIEGRLHRSDGPAMESDDGNLWAVRGALVPDEQAEPLERAWEAGNRKRVAELLAVWDPCGVTVQQLDEALDACAFAA